MKTFKVTAPAGIRIYKIGSFQHGETFEVPTARADALRAVSGLEEVIPPKKPKQDKPSAQNAPVESEG
jgi:hypothetical protein